MKETEEEEGEDEEKNQTNKKEQKNRSGSAAHHVSPTEQQPRASRLRARLGVVHHTAPSIY